MRKVYESPKMFADTFVANTYFAACLKPQYEISPQNVRCTSPGHTNTQYISMFLDSQDACIAKFVPNVGSSSNGIFYTQFEACAYVDGCNKQNWLASHPRDTYFSQHVKDHGTYNNDRDGFISHNTQIDLSTAQTYNLS